MIEVSGNVADVGLQPLSGKFIATSIRFRTEGDVVVASEARSWPIVGGMVSAELLPGPARITIVVGSHSRAEWDVTVPDADVSLASLIEDSVEWPPSVVSSVAAHRAAAVAAADRAELAVAEFGLVASTSTLAPGSPATVVVSGEGPSYTVEFGVPTGEQGPPGPPGDVSLGQLTAGLAGKADLVGGQVPTGQLPAVALTKPMPVSSRAGMLALTAQEGDVAVITAGVDKGTYMLGAGPSTVFSSWVQLISPDGPVQSVNGQTGTVVLSKADVGLGNVSNTSDDGKPISTATQAALTPLQGRVGAAPACWFWSGTSLPTSASVVHSQARVGDFIVAPNLTADPGWHRITGV